MKPAIFLLSLACARATVLTADFNSMPAQAGTQFTANGITFTSQTPISLAANTALFGWGDATQSIAVHNTGWLAISTGSLMTDVRFLVGLDWNWGIIESGLLDTFFNWQAWNGDTLVAAGSTKDPAHFHGGGIRDVSVGDGFDRLLVSETATLYQAVTTNGIDFTRGAAFPATGQNSIALDDVAVTLMGGGLAALGVGVPDSAGTAVLLGLALLALGVKRFN